MLHRFITCVLIAIVVYPAAVRAQHINGAGIATAGTRPTEAVPPANGPVERREPVGKGQSPAFPGQTRAPGVVTTTPLDIQVVANGLRFPWALAFLPDHNILITEKPG